MLDSRSDKIGADRTEVEQSFDPRSILTFLWRHWMLIATGVVIGLLIGEIFLAGEPLVYTASTEILLEPQNQSPVAAAAANIGFDIPAIDSQLAIIRSSSFLQRVVEREHLVNDPEFGTAKPPAQPLPDRSILGGIYSYFGRPAITTTPRPPAPENPDKPSRSQVISSVYSLMGATSVYRTGQAYVLVIAVTSVDPSRAARLANAIADVYVIDKLDSRFDAAKRASAWLNDRLVDLGKQLRDSEEAVTRFRDRHGVVLTAANVPLSQQNLSNLNAAVLAAKADLAKKKSLLDSANSVQMTGNDGLILAELFKKLPDALNSTAMQKYREQWMSLEQREAEAKANYTDLYPPLLQMQRERSGLQAAVSFEIQRIAANVRTDYQNAEFYVEESQRLLKEALEKVSGEVSVDNETAIPLRELERTAAVNKTLYEDFLRQEKTLEQSTFEVRDVRVLNPALPPGAPSYPRPGRVMAWALAMGLFGGIGAGFVREMINRGFITPREIEDTLGLPVLASINRLPHDVIVDRKGFHFSLLPIAKPLSRHSESLRALRSGIQMTDVDDPPKVIQLSSALPGEGKTTIALSLAASAAASGLRALFVDADLRHRSASRIFGLEKSPGLVDLLVGTNGPQSFIKFQDDGKFWILPAGSKTQNPSDLLNSERMRALMIQLRGEFDFVVLDTPPLSAVTDPIATARLVDKIVLVVRWAATAREMVQHVVGMLPRRDKIAGIALNLVNEKRARKYGKNAFLYKYSSKNSKYYIE